MKPEGRSPLKATAMRKKRRPVLRLRPVANILSQSIWRKARKAVSVSSIHTNRRCPALDTRGEVLECRARGSGNAASSATFSPILEQLMISLQVFYEGRVQGVGFRFTVRHIAKEFDVTGWVRNLPDGRVELHVVGEEDEVHAFVRRIGDSELHSLI